LFPEEFAHDGRCDQKFLGSTHPVPILDTCGPDSVLDCNEGGLPLGVQDRWGAICNGRYIVSKKRNFYNKFLIKMRRLKFIPIEKNRPP
jgi:hypothetical protein